jgi:hypothetical protein
MGVIYVAHGKTGAGKTKVANYLESEYGVRHYHPFGFEKRFEENLCDMSEGFLDTVEGKNAPIPNNESENMQAFMVAKYHFYKEWMPGRTSLAMRRHLPKLLEYNDICVVSLRNIAEVEALVDIRDAGHHQLIVFSLHRESAKLETSDENYGTIKDMLWTSGNMMFPVNNNFSLEHLHTMLDDIIRYCR